MESGHIIWPAILKYKGEHELAYIPSQSDWDSDADLHVFAYEIDDQLIDSQGFIYSLNCRKNNLVVPEQTNRSLSLPEVSGLIKAHLSELGSCCVSKLFAPSIKEAIAMMHSSN